MSICVCIHVCMYVYMHMYARIHMHVYVRPAGRPHRRKYQETLNLHGNVTLSRPKFKSVRYVTRYYITTFAQRSSLTAGFPFDKQRQLLAENDRWQIRSSSYNQCYCLVDNIGRTRGVRRRPTATFSHLSMTVLDERDKSITKLNSLLKSELPRVGGRPFLLKPFTRICVQS